MKCPKCGHEHMWKFKMRSTSGFEKVRNVNHWVCPKCGYAKDFEDREV